MADRRSFLKRFGGSIAAAAAFTAVPKAAQKLLASKPVPSPLFVSIGTKRPGWTKRCIRLASRLRGVRTAFLTAGVAASAALKAAFRMGGRAIWFDPMFRPSLRNIKDGSIR